MNRDGGAKLTPPCIKAFYQILDDSFFTNDSITSDRYRPSDEKVNGDYPSVHHPVMIEYHLSG